MTYELRTGGGRITVTDGALARIVVRAAESVDGARVRRPRRGLAVAVGDGRARVSVGLAARHGTILPDLGREVQERVAAALASMCGVRATVDVTIEDLDA